MRLFDTTFLIDLVDGDEGAARLAKRVDQEGSYRAISAVTVQEYLRGIYYLFGEDHELLQRKLASAESELRRFEIIPYSYEIAKVGANIEAELAKMGRIMGFADTIIAATARHLGLKLVTRDIQHFQRILHLRLENY